MEGDDGQRAPACKRGLLPWAPLCSTAPQETAAPLHGSRGQEAFGALSLTKEEQKPSAVGPARPRHEPSKAQLRGAVLLGGHSWEWH